MQKKIRCMYVAIRGKKRSDNNNYFDTLGVVTITQVSLLSSSFMADPPTFTLIANTSGGPPEDYTWTRDGVEISGENYSIALSNNSQVIYQESLYYSNLTIRGRLPGVYEYSVTNRATPAIQNQSYTIEGTF